MNFNPWEKEIEKEKEFWESMGENQGYISIDCPNCGRHRVEHWSCGKDICEKCLWCIQENDYFYNEYFNL